MDYIGEHLLPGKLGHFFILLSFVSSLGAAFAYSRDLDGHQVTAVGEVPAATVEAIAAGVTRGTPAGVQSPVQPAPQSAAAPPSR